MTEAPFGEAYADAYDVIYASKDYAEEARTVGRLLERYAEGPVQSVLDVGCGSGRHALELAALGLQVTGLDRSPAMVARAQQRLQRAHADVRARVGFLQADAGAAPAWQVPRVDAAVMMFAVMGYLTRNEELAHALGHLRQALRPGGVFVFDVWFGPAVLMQRPGDRLAQWPTPSGGTLLRAATSRLDVRQQTCTVEYTLVRAEGPALSRWQETHVMRFFFEQELHLLLGQAGMQLVHLGGFPDVDASPGPETWSVCGVARRS